MIKTHLIEKKNPQHNQEWSWDETDETRAALAKFWIGVAKNIEAAKLL